MTTNGDADRIERDLEHTRARLDATIDALQTKLSPKELVDQAVSYVKEGGGADFARNLGVRAKDNPLPVALVGIGLAWLMASSNRPPAPPRESWRSRESHLPPRDYDRPDPAAAHQSLASYQDRGAVSGSLASYENGGELGGGTGMGTGTTTGARAEIGGESYAYGRHGYGSGGSYESAKRHMYEDEQHMPYEAAAYDDLATKAHHAGAQVQRHQDEDESAFQERLHTARGTAIGLTRSVGETLAAFKDRVEEAISAAAERLREIKDSAVSGASHMMDRDRGRSGGYDYGRYDYDRPGTPGYEQQRRGMVGNAYDYGRSAANNAYDYGRSAAHAVGDRASEYGRSARDVGARTIDYLEDHPLVMGALGLTVGAVLGMLVPPTRYERERFGELAGNLSEQARGVAAQAGESAQRVAGAVLDAARDSAGREDLGSNLSPAEMAARAREQVHDTAHRARNVVEEAVSAGREALDRELHGGGREQERDQQGRSQVAGGGAASGSSGSGSSSLAGGSGSGGSMSGSTTTTGGTGTTSTSAHEQPRSIG